MQTSESALGSARGKIKPSALIDPALFRLRYEPEPNWGRLPSTMTFGGDATSVAVDSDDNVYVFNRGPTPVVVFDRHGNFMDAWNVGAFNLAHGITIDADNGIYFVDYMGHCVQKWLTDGTREFVLGAVAQSVEAHSGKCFNMPTDVAVYSESGDIFVSDGYRNSHVHRFDFKGKHLHTWGAPGADPGQFSLPHGIALTSDGRVIVCDRENFRLQLFSTDGEFLVQWHAHRPVAVRTAALNGYIYVAELGPGGWQQGIPNLGNRVSIYDNDGVLVGRFGDPFPGTAPNQFIAPHGLAIDSSGDVYVAEVAQTWCTEQLQQTPTSGEIISLRKWRLL